MRKIILGLLVMLALGSMDMQACFAWCKKPVRRAIPADDGLQAQPMIVTDPAELLFYAALFNNVVRARVLLETGLSAEDCRSALNWSNTRGNPAVAQVIEQHLRWGDERKAWILVVQQVAATKVRLDLD